MTTLSMTLEAFIKGIKAKRDTVPFLPDMEADDLFVTEGDILPVTREVFDFRFELLPPRWQSRNAFAYAEGGNQTHFFWQESHDYYVLKMSDEESAAFYELLGQSRYQ